MAKKTKGKKLRVYQYTPSIQPGPGEVTNIILLARNKKNAWTIVEARLKSLNSMDIIGKVKRIKLQEPAAFSMVVEEAPKLNYNSTAHPVI